MLSAKKTMLSRHRAISGTSVLPYIGSNKIVMGFWHNWPGAGSPGYQGGRSKDMILLDIPEQYNVVAVAFMKGANVPTFKPYNMSDAEFRRQVDILHSQNRLVLISLGGADAHIALTHANTETFIAEIKRLVTVYGFDGLDIDLEQAAITAADNRVVIPQALRAVKDHYRTMGKNFIISMAPEFPYLNQGREYQPYIDSLAGYYDLIAPQYYNQGGDGVFVEGIGWLAQNNESSKEDFLYYLTDSLIHGTRGFISIPADKLAIGLPTNRDAAATGYVINPADALDALERLEQAGTPIRGLMTWSVNWDDGFDNTNNLYGWEFIHRYGHLSGGQPPAPSEKPSAPTELKSIQQTTNSITLQWNPSCGAYPIEFYEVYRNEQRLPNRIASTVFTDNGLTSNTDYRYTVRATDNRGNNSELSALLFSKTLSESAPSLEWTVSTWYSDNDLVNYQGVQYCCLMQHTSNPYWTPDKATSLWALISRTS